jgi:predicted dehydrogenase
MARNASEAREMLAAAESRPDLVTQIVPSPLGLWAHKVVQQRIADGFLGELREVVVLGTNAALTDADAPLHWRQDAELSGLNMLALGILHEPLMRWIPDPVAVLAQTHVFTTQRRGESGQLQDVGTPDSVHVLTELPNGARGVYHLSGVMHFGPDMQIHLYGTEGTLKYEFAPQDRLFGGRRGEKQLAELEVPEDQAGGWRVEQDFIDAIRGVKPIEFTDFATGVRYMEFTEAVARSASSGQRVQLPLTP